MKKILSCVFLFVFSFNYTLFGADYTTKNNFIPEGTINTKNKEITLIQVARMLETLGFQPREKHNSKGQNIGYLVNLKRGDVRATIFFSVSAGEIVWMDTDLVSLKKSTPKSESLLGIFAMQDKLWPSYVNYIPNLQVFQLVQPVEIFSEFGLRASIEKFLDKLVIIKKVVGSDPEPKESNPVKPVGSKPTLDIVKAIEEEMKNPDMLRAIEEEMKNKSTTSLPVKSVQGVLVGNRKDGFEARFPGKPTFIKGDGDMERWEVSIQNTAFCVGTFTINPTMMKQGSENILKKIGEAMAGDGQWISGKIGTFGPEKFPMAEINCIRNKTNVRILLVLKKDKVFSIMVGSEEIKNIESAVASDFFSSFRIFNE